MAKTTIKKGSGSANNDDYKKYREAAKAYKQAKAAQEVLEKTIAQDAQEATEEQEKLTEQQAQEILANTAVNFDMDIITGAIIVNGDIRPELNPQEPQFNRALYNRIAAAANEQIAARLEPLRAEVEKSASAVMNSEAMQGIIETLNSVLEPILPAMQAVKEFSQNIGESLNKTIGDSIKYIIEHSEDLQRQLQEWEQLQPYLEEELKKPEYGGRTIEDIMSFSSDDIAENDLNDDLLNRAVIAAKAAMLAQQLPAIIVTGKVDDLDYPLDKINSNVWKLLKEADKDGQLTATFAVEKRGSKKEANIIYGINFDALEGVTITKKLTGYDKRVYIAAGALFNNGYEVMTVSQIYNAMGNNGRPHTSDIEKINDSLTKMRAAHIYLNNESENQLYSKYERFIYDASLLPMERISAVVNGQTTDSAIHLFREPPLISFARQRKQITTIKRSLLESPLSQTEPNLLIEDYLLERISHIKNSKGKLINKMLYSTIYEKCQITTKMQRKRAPEKIHKLLEHYKNNELIKDYTEEADGITIYY